MSQDLQRPAGVELSPGWVQGRQGLRLMVILRAPGCVFARRNKGGCTNCGFWQHLTTNGQPVTAANFQAQLEHALAQHPEQLDQVAELDLFCSGSFFCDQEVLPEARVALLGAALPALPALRHVVAESRPEYINQENLRQARAALGAEASLEVGIGLESANAEIREQRIRKGFTLDDFEGAAALLAREGIGLGIYLLLKPRGTTEEEAVEDVKASGRYLLGLRRRLPGLSMRVALGPTFVPRGTLLHQDLLAGQYVPPSLWSVVRVVRDLAPHFPIRVGLSHEGLPADHLPAGCERCTGGLRQAIARFNQTQDCGILDHLTCSCNGYQLMDGHGG